MNIVHAPSKGKNRKVSFSRTAAVTVSAALMLTVSACSSNESKVEVSPSPSVSTPGVFERDFPAELVLSGVVENDGLGDYARVKLADDAEVYNYDPSVVLPEVFDAGFTEAEITEVLRLGADFSVEEGLDSILVDSDRVDEWYEANQHWFSPDNQASVQEALEDRTPGAVLSGLVDNDVNDVRNHESNYSLVADGGARIIKFEMDNTSVLLAPDGALAVEFKGMIHRPAIKTDGGKGAEVLNFTQTYAFKEIDGKWLISGWLNDFTYDK